MKTHDTTTRSIQNVVNPGARGHVMKDSILQKLSMMALGLLTSVGHLGLANAAIECGSSAARHRDMFPFPALGYWMQKVDSVGGKPRMTYTSVGGTYSMMYNTATSLSEEITRHFDAFPIPPGDLYVHPNSGYSFYKTGSGENAQPLFNDNASYGVYQSVGVRERGKNYRVVRVAAGWGSGRFMDYKISQTTNGYDFQKLYEGPISVCQNLPSRGLDSEIPILSRDGNMISGRGADGKTKIYRIHDLPQRNPQVGPAECTEIRSVDLETGKISFSFTNKSAMFVMKDPNTDKGRLVEVDIETGELTTLSLPSEDVMYMTYGYDDTFAGDSELIFSRRIPGESDKSELVVINPGSVAKKADANAKLFEALGYLWGDACNLEDLDTDYARAAGSRLVNTMCDELVTDARIQALPRSYRTLDKSKIMNLCRSASRL